MLTKHSLKAATISILTVAVALIGTPTLHALTDTQLLITQPANAVAVQVTQQGQTTNSTSTGGAINLNNTANTGAGLVLYSNAGATATGNLFSARSDNVLFSQATIYGTSSGTGPTMLLVNRSTGSNAPAANIVSNNPSFSAMGVSGVETGHGTVKISHTGSGNDANAAGISVDAAGSGTAAQMFYGTSTGPQGTTGDGIHLTNKLNDGTGNYVQQDIFRVSAGGFTTTKNGFRVLDQNGDIQMKDRATGEEYQIYIENGVLKAVKL